MSARHRLVGVVLALLLPALVLGRWLLVADTPLPAPPSLSLPAEVGPWRLTRESRLEDDVVAMIEPDAYTMRLYEAPGRTPVWLYLGLYAGRAGYSRNPHDPEVCYPAQGWEILRTEALKVPISDGATLRARRIEVHLGPAFQSVVYWFQPASRWPAPAALEELLRVFDAIQGRPQYAFVRISGQSDGGDSAARDLAEFSAAMANYIRATVERARSASPAEGAARVATSGP